MGWHAKYLVQTQYITVAVLSHGVPIITAATGSLADAKVFTWPALSFFITTLGGSVCSHLCGE